MNRFYAATTDVLVKTNAFIDKLVGDEVIGIYLPIFTGPNHARPATQAALDLLRATGHGDRGGPWLPVGVGVHTGRAFFGTVSGAEGTFSDFTALGLGGHLKTGQLWTGENRPVGEPPQARVLYRGRS